MLWGVFADDSFVGNLSQAGFLCKMWERSSSMQRNKRRHFPHAGEGTAENLCLWVGKAYLGSQKDGTITWRSTPGGIIGKMSHIRLRKSSELELVGFLGETPHAHFPLHLLPIGDRTWTEWTRFRTCYA